MLFEKSVDARRKILNYQKFLEISRNILFLEMVGEFCTHSKNLLGINIHVLNNAVDSRKKSLMLLEKY